MQRFYQHIVKSNTLAIAILLAVTAVCFTKVQAGLTANNSVHIFFAKSDPDLQRYNNSPLYLESERQVVVVFDPAGEGVDQADLGTLNEFIAAANKLPYVSNISSIDNTNLLKPETDLFYEYEEWKASEENVIENLLTVDVLGGQFYSFDKQKLGVYLELNFDDFAPSSKYSMVTEIHQIANNHLGDEQSYLSGAPMIFGSLDNSITTEILPFLGLAVVLILLFFYLNVPSIPAMLALFAVIAMSNILMVGVLGFLGWDMNLVSALTPVTISTFALADGIHLPLAYRRLSREYSSRLELVYAVLQQCFVPCLMTTVTTIIGCGALLATSIPALETFAWAASMGVLNSFVLTMFLMVALFYRVDLKIGDSKLYGVVRRVVTASQALLFRRTRTVGIVSAIAIVVLALGSLRTYFDNDWISYLPEGGTFYSEHLALEETWGPPFPIDFFVTQRSGAAVNDHATLKTMERAEENMSALPGIDRGISLTSFYKWASEIQNGDRAVLDPGTVADVNAQLMDEGQNAFHRYLSDDKQIARLSGKTLGLSSKTFVSKRNEIMASLREVFGDKYDVVATGYVNLYATFAEKVVHSQILNVAAGLLLTVLVLLFWLRSWVLTAVATIPSITVLVALFGIIGLLELPIDLPLMIVATVVLGISVDDTIHFLFHWRKCHAEGMSWEASIDSVFSKVGSAAVLTSISVAFGFPVFLISEVVQIQTLSWLMIYGSVVALLADLFLLPILLKLIHDRGIVQAKAADVADAAAQPKIAS